MKKVIRLTESDLMRIVKRVIKESDGEDNFETLINLGFDNMFAFYLTMVEGNGTWTELFNMYGKEIAELFFYNNYWRFIHFVLASKEYSSYTLNLKQPELPKLSVDDLDNFTDADWDEFNKKSDEYHKPKRKSYMMDFYPNWDGTHSQMIDILINYFFDGDKKEWINEYGSYLINHRIIDDVHGDTPMIYEYHIYLALRQYRGDFYKMEDEIEENFGKSLDDILYEYQPFNVDNINDLYNLLK
jgi:hypothetical protein